MEESGRNFHKSVESLMTIIDKSMDYSDDSNDKRSRLKTELKNLKTIIENCFEKVKTIESFAPEYDIDDDTPANGYRSFTDIFGSTIGQISCVCLKINSNRESFLFRADYYAKYKVQRGAISFSISFCFDSTVKSPSGPLSLTPYRRFVRDWLRRTQTVNPVAFSLTMTHTTAKSLGP